jgi:uncharacterized protein YggT (Ycf19 family)
MLFADLNHTTSQLAHVFDHFTQSHIELEQVLTPTQHLSFIRRWNLLSFKVSEAHHYIGLNNFNQSVFHIRSARHDLAVMRRHVTAAIGRVKYTQSDCYNTASSSWSSSSSSSLYTALQRVFTLMFAPFRVLLLPLLPLSLIIIVVYTVVWTTSLFSSSSSSSSRSSSSSSFISSVSSCVYAFVRRVGVAVGVGDGGYHRQPQQRVMRRKDF